MGKIETSTLKKGFQISKENKVIVGKKNCNSITILKVNVEEKNPPRNLYYYQQTIDLLYFCFDISNALLYFVQFSESLQPLFPSLNVPNS